MSALRFREQLVGLHQSGWATEMALVVRLLAYGFVNGSSLKLAFLLHSNLLKPPCCLLLKQCHWTRVGDEGRRGRAV